MTSAALGNITGALQKIFQWKTSTGRMVKLDPPRGACGSSTLAYRSQLRNQVHKFDLNSSILKFHIFLSKQVKYKWCSCSSWCNTPRRWISPKTTIAKWIWRRCSDPASSRSTTSDHHSKHDVENRSGSTNNIGNYHHRVI
jgi:hypothetical protein